MGDFSFVMTAAFGCVVATETLLLPGSLSLAKVIASGSAIVATLFCGVVLAASLNSRR
jgi:hypothetical protein